MTVKKSLTEAHHKLGDILDLLRRNQIVELVHGKSHATVAYMVPPNRMSETCSSESEEEGAQPNGQE